MKSLVWNMHGLIFETSIWLLAGSTRCLLQCQPPASTQGPKIVQWNLEWRNNASPQTKRKTKPKTHRNSKEADGGNMHPATHFQRNLGGAPPSPRFPRNLRSVSHRSSTADSTRNLRPPAHGSSTADSKGNWDICVNTSKAGLPKSSYFSLIARMQSGAETRPATSRRQAARLVP